MLPSSAVVILSQSTFPQHKGLNVTWGGSGGSAGVIYGFSFAFIKLTLFCTTLNDFCTQNRCL